MKSRPFSFPKSSRLKLRSDFNRLFLNGKSIREHPVKAMYQFHSGSEPLMAGVTVPKKLFPRATDRNYFKRLMREAFRLHSGPLREQLRNNTKALKILFIFTGKKQTDFPLIQSKIILILQRFHEMAADKGAGGAHPPL